MKKIFALIASIAILVTVGLSAGTAGTAGTLAKCTGCHGKTFEKKALGKSAVVRDMNETVIIDAIKGYQDGTYGGSMKGLMKGQVKGLDANKTAKEIKNL